MPATLLHIEASPNGEHSTSTAMARAFLEAYAQQNPQDSVRTLNVWSDEVPSFGREHARAKFAPLMGESRSAQEAAAWREVVAIVKDFDASDKILISCPMWNYSVPHALKNYIDLLVQPLLSFGFDPQSGQHVGLLADRPVQLLLTRSSVGEEDPADYQLPYLRHILGFIGLRDLRVVVAGSTTQPPDRRSAYVKTQCERARVAAAAF